MLRRLVFIFVLFSILPMSWAVTTPAATIANTVDTQAPLRQATASVKNATAKTPADAAITALQQKHKQEFLQQQKRLSLLEQANQQALAQNQELQLKNDNLTVQVQVLQSERSAQMFLYGAATFGGGVLVGILIYNLLYTRRRRQW